MVCYKKDIYLVEAATNQRTASTLYLESRNVTKQSKMIREFWQVFQANKAELVFAPTAENPVYDTILNKLQQINPGLFIEFSSNAGVCELIITADGDKSLFHLVESIINDAPEITDWSIIPLKPRLGLPISASWEGTVVSLADVVFDPLERTGSQDLGIRVYVPNLDPQYIEDAHNAILRALSHALGEVSFAEDLQYVETLPLPEGNSAEDYIPLNELEKFINWRKNNQQR